MQGGNVGLAKPCASSMGAKYDRKVTPGIIELSRLRAQIDGAVCYLDVGSSEPGRAEKTFFEKKCLRKKFFRERFF